MPDDDRLPTRCLACARELRWNGDALRSWTCPECTGTFTECLYCRQPSQREGSGLRTCQNADCPAYRVSWRRCGNCGEWRGLEVDPSGYSICVAPSCYNGYTAVRCARCHDLYPVALGTCARPGCDLAFRAAPR